MSVVMAELLERNFGSKNARLKELSLDLEKKQQMNILITVEC